MLTNTLIQWLRPSNKTRVDAPHELLTRKQFLHVVDRERSRTDRTGREFTIVTLTVDEHRIASLAKLCDRRLRITDDKGRLAHDRIGLILPETNAIDAAVVIRDICRDFSDHDEIDADIFVYPNPEDGEGHSSLDQYLDVDVEPANSIRPLRPMFAQAIQPWKRGLDILGALVGLVVAVPIVAIAALLIKLSSKGPVFFAQKRSGLGGKPFTMYKLRTMRTGAEAEKATLRQHSEQDGPAFKMKNDPRVTLIGRILRKTSIDELPQLWNILKGDMSLVGPRPLPCDESNACEPWQKRRLDVTPGLTCIWQVEGRSLVTFDEWARLDVQYIQQHSFWTDTKLILKTVPAVIFKKGAC